MNKLQNTILMIADEIKRICEKHEIKYYIVAGTLLGAVRHQGFIPWDDDLDIIMTRLDFERFIQICQIELDSSKFYLQCGGNEEYYAFEFAKIQLKGTKIIEDFNWNVPIQNGIFVDIFPLDNLPDNYIKREILKAKNYILKNLIWIKCGYGVRTHGNFWWYRLGKGVCRLFSLKWLKKKIYQVITKYAKRIIKIHGLKNTECMILKIINLWVLKNMIKV